MGNRNSPDSVPGIKEDIASRYDDCYITEGSEKDKSYARLDELWMSFCHGKTEVKDEKCRFLVQVIWKYYAILLQ